MGNINKNEIFEIDLKVINHEKGNILKFINENDINFFGFGEIYFSHIKYNLIKGWKKHLRMSMNLTVIKGNVKFVFFDSNKNFICEKIIGTDNYKIITVPPLIWFGFKGLSKQESILCNFSNILHDPDESEELKLNELKFDW